MSEVNQYHEETRDFSTLGKSNETANIQARREADVNAAKLEEKKEQEEDAQSTVRQQAVAQMQEMFKIGGIEISREDLSKINKKYTDAVEGKSEAELQAQADKEGISVEYLVVRASMAEYIEQNGYDKAELEAKFGTENVEKYETNVDEDLSVLTQQKQDLTSTAATTNSDTQASVEQTDEKQTAEAKIVDEGEAELDFLESGNIPTSLAKSVSQDGTTTASIQKDFGQAAELTTANVTIPTQNVTPEYQSALTV